MRMHPLRLSLFALLLLAVLGLSQEAEGELVEVYLNDSPELLTFKADIAVESGKDLNLKIHIKGSYRIDSGDDNLSVYSILIQSDFLNDADLRDSAMGVPQYQPLGDNESDPGYDEVHSRFSANDSRFSDYLGDIRINIVMKNNSADIVWEGSVSFEIIKKSDSHLTDNNLEDSNTLIEDNTYQILGVAVGIVGLIIVAVVRTRSPTNVHDPYALPKSDDNYSPISYENDRRSDEVAKQIKTLEEPKVNKGTNGDDKFTKLQDLKTMYKEGLIDEGEFKKLKKEILD